MPRKKKDANKFGDLVEKEVTRRLYDEYTVAERNQAADSAEFESIIDILECKRTEKDYDWLSDVFIPEYPSIHLTEASQWANQYFPTRDFVDTYLDGSTEENVEKAKVAKKFINSMLNVKNLYHYGKYMRARGINSTFGCCYAVCSWKQVLKEVETVVQKQQQAGVGYDGQPYMMQVPEAKVETVVVEDRFHYEVPDPRNVFTDSSYCYSIQEKEWIIIRSEMSYEQLKEMEKENGYFNLEILKKAKPEKITETARKLGDDSGEPDETQLKYFDILERFGKSWAVVEEKDNDGYPLKIAPAYNDSGELKESAELVESIITMAFSGGLKTLIRFQPTPFKTSKNVPFRPIVRGLNYIHPTKDVGMSDAKYARELQVALNDTINLSNDRVKLATMPTLKVRRYALEDNDSIYFEPEHMMLVENPDDITEFQIRDNMQGALAQAQMFINKMQQVESIYPTTMGDLPGRASTTATAIQGAESRTNLRANYKSLTFEYTFLTEFYWMMMQMGYQFMRPETATAMLGDTAQYFDPEADYHFQPVSSNIEIEYNKNQKVKNIDQMIGRLSGLVQFMPGIIFPILKMTQMQFELLGQEVQTIVPYLVKVIEMGMNPEGKNQTETPADQGPPMTSNQAGVPVQGLEEQVRGGQGNMPVV